jgi:CheY-like chemotaxis protein
MDLRQACVMLVEDQAAMRVFILGSLRRLGAQNVHAFADGASAMAALDSLKPDLILTDVHMQPVDGISFVRSVRALADPQLRATRVVFLSGDATPATRHEAESLGVCEFIVKPPVPAAMGDTLARVLGAQP